MNVGRQVLSQQSGVPVAVIAIPEGVDWKAVGITVDWSTVAAVSGSDVTIPEEGTVIKVGKKYLRFGQIMTKITQAEVQTLDLSGDDDPGGGTWNITDILGEEVADIAWNVSGATLQAAIRAALADVEFADQITVSKSSFVYTITFPPELNNVATITVDATGLTGGVGDTFAITVGTTTQGVATAGYYGPYDPAATDGRQTLTRGSCFVLDQTFQEDPTGLLGSQNYPPVFDGGQVWRKRLLITTGTHSLAAGPTVAEFETAFPRIGYVNS